MTITTVRPNSTVSGGANYAITGGSASLQAATNDNSDSTYIRKASGVSGTASCILNFGTTSVTSSQVVRRIRLRARVQTTTTDGKLNLQLGTRVNGINYFHPALTVRGQEALGEIVGAWYTISPKGTAWNQDAVDDIRCQITEYRDSTDRAYIYELYIDVDKAAKPTLTVSDPTGTITTTSRPVTTWTYSDTDGDAQSYYEIKVFASSAYGSGSFDPGTASPVWTSGQVNSTSNSITVGDYLANGTYRAYVRVAKTINAAPFWSDWAYSTFTISLSPPTTPTLTTTFFSASNRVRVNMTGAAATGYDSQTFEVQRTDDGGLTWAGVRDAGELVPSGTYTAEVYDYEAPRGQSVSYRARSVAIVGNDVVASAWSTSSTVAVTNDGAWWIKAISNPTLNASSVNVLAGLDEQVVEDIGVFRPIGRDRSVVLFGSTYGKDGSYRVLTLSSAEFNSIYTLLTHQGTLLVQDPFGSQKYVRITSRSINTTGAATQPRRQIEVSYVEVSE